GLDLRAVSLLPPWAGEPLPAGTVHRVSARRWLRGAGRGRPAVLLPYPGAVPGPRRGAAALRGTDRVPRPAAGGRCSSPRPLRVRRRRPPHRPGRTLSRVAGVRLHPRGRPRGAGVRDPTGGRVGRG